MFDENQKKKYISFHQKLSVAEIVTSSSMHTSHRSLLRSRSCWLLVTACPNWHQSQQHQLWVPVRSFTSSVVRSAYGEVEMHV